jgi:SprT-like protein
MADADPLQRYAVAADASHEEFLAAAKLYARAVVDRHDLAVDVTGLDWEVSTRAKRRAGAVLYRDGDPETVRLTWGQFENRGWPAAAATVRHELVHVHRLAEADDPSHGEAFRRLADELDTHVHCERFTDPEWWVTCVDCGAQLARYRRSKLVENPADYRCGSCGGSFRVERAD